MVRKLQDITTMVEEVFESRVFDSTSTYETFPQYRDPLARLDMNEMHNWVKEQKQVAAIEWCEMHIFNLDLTCHYAGVVYRVLY